MRGNRIRKIIAAGLCALLLCGLFTPAVSEEYRELKYGSKGEDVQRFKKAMFWLGYFSTEDLDGTYTATTADRVKKLQKNNGLKQTGIAAHREKSTRFINPLLIVFHTSNVK